MNAEVVRDYRDRLEKGIEEYMSCAISQRSAEILKSMLDVLEAVKECCPEETAVAMASTETYETNHWTVAETSALDKPRSVDDKTWNETVNMMYSDHMNTARKYGIDMPEFYADLAKDFLLDADTIKGSEKMKAYKKAVKLR